MYACMYVQYVHICMYRNRGLTPLQLCNAFQQGIEGIFSALPVGGRLVVQLCLLLLQLGHLGQQLVL